MVLAGTFTRRIRHRDDRDDEQGSLILDILIGMAIFALIAIIAVSAISQYRERAYEQGAVSDVGAIGLALEASYTDTQAYPTDAAALVTTLASSGVSSTKNMTVASYTPTARDFVVCVEHKSGETPDAYAVYDSSRGGVTDSGRGEGCPASVGPPAGPTDGEPFTVGTGSLPCPEVTYAVTRGTIANSWRVQLNWPSVPGATNYRLTTVKPDGSTTVTAFNAPNTSGVLVLFSTPDPRTTEMTFNSRDIMGPASDGCAVKTPLFDSVPW